MGGFQKFRGNPETKLLYVIDQLIGGINTDFSDDVSADNEFKSIVNFSMDKRGSLYKRKGFGKLNAVSQIFNLFEEIPETLGRTPENPNPEKTNDNIVYMKLLRNDNSCFRNLSAFSGDKSYREYQKIYGAQNNTWKLLMITTSNYTNTSKAWIFTCVLKPLNYSEDGQELPEDTIEVSSKIIELPVLFKWNRNLKNIDTIEFFDKIYFTNNNKGLVCFDRTKETFTYSGTGISGQENQAYKPNAMEIRKVGFNLLGDDPLHWVDFQGLSTDSIQGIYLTTEDNKPLQIIPSGGKFRLNVLYTGENKEFTIALKEGEKELKVTSKANSGLTTTGLKVYDITISNVPTSQVEIKITMNDSTIDPYYDYYDVGQVDPETKKVETLNIGDCGMVEMYNRAVYYKDDTIWFSEINNFNYIPNYNYILLPIEPTDKITKIIYFRNVYIVFTKSRIYKMLGSFGDSDFQLMPLNLSIGCHAPDTVIPIENVLYFASPRGLYQLISSASYTTSSATFENVKEIDTKVKQLTSDVTMYLGEKDDPAVRYNGISENAAAIRYKDKYMLFYNTAFQQGDIAALKNLDVLVYQYELKAFSEIKFPIKPTFIFMVDGAIETFCTVAEKEEYTEQETLMEYNFEEQTEGTVLEDLSGNGFDANVIGGAILSPGIGLRVNGSDNTYAKAGILNTSVNLKEGFEVTVDANVNNLTDGKLFSFAQSTPTGSGKQDSFSIYTSWSNGYRGQLICNTVPNPETGKNKVNWKFRIHRDSTSRNAKQSGAFNLKDKSGKLLINTVSFNFSMGSALYDDVSSGSFTVSHNSSGNYSNKWELKLSSKYPTYSTGWNKGADVYFDQRQGSSFDNSIGIRVAGVARAYDGGCNIYFTPYLALNGDASLYIGSRAMYTWVDGVEHYHTVGSVSTSGGGQFSGGEQSQSKNYTGQPTIFIDARYNIRATINGVYRENVDIGGFNVTLPSVNSYQITTWHDFTTTGTKSITLSQILSPSDRELYVKVNKSDSSLVIGCFSEYNSTEQSTPSDLDITGRHIFKFTYTPSGDDFKVAISIDGTVVANVVVDGTTIVNGNRDKNTIGYEIDGILHSFNVSNLSNKSLIMYSFDEGKGDILTDKSGNSRDGMLVGDYSWLTESGLLFDGVSGYVVLPNIEQEHRFSNGFSVEFEAKIGEMSKACKIFDLATGFDTGLSSNGKCSINCNISANSPKIDYMTTSVDYKSYKLSYSDPSNYDRNKWKFTVTDNGKGYDLVLFKNDEEVARTQFSYGGITNIDRKSNFIGKSNNPNDGLFKGMLYNFKIIINASSSPVPIYNGAMYEYDTTYDDFGRPMEIELESKGINLQYPLHTKKVKNIFVKGLGGYNYNSFFFELYSDGHLVNNPKIYNCYVDEVTRQVVYDYTDNRELSFNEMTSLLGNMRLNYTKLGNSNYETRKLILPAKGKNFTIKLYGESSDYLSLESFGFVFKLGKVKEE